MVLAVIAAVGSFTHIAELAAEHVRTGTSSRPWAPANWSISRRTTWTAGSPTRQRS
ncbi:hypothetical protein FHU36_001676 [Nonomuraea muscovyensis]|uniref:Uncharacterized protein n=1 Tax=Nonomuraea muscovyensis TaxID=1124761 RepID=A0A7X0EUV2_9ACTN|nr:hypothetical protein [Nonomuraea muscovyensis]